MVEANKNEKIIELTEIVEEKPIKFSPPALAKEIADSGGKKKEEPQPVKGIPGTLKNSPPRNAPLNYEKEPAGKTDLEAPNRSIPVSRSSQPLYLDYETEVQDMKKALDAKAREWVASEGVKVMERVAREIFPRIAEEILQKEIEKLKTEAEEKE